MQIGFVLLVLEEGGYEDEKSSGLGFSVVFTGG